MGVLALALAGCAQTYQPSPEEENTEPQAQEETGPITIGAVYPLTGNGAAYGIPMQQVIKIAVDKVNRDGGINGRNLEVVWEDGKCLGDAAAAASQKLIGVDKVQLILGGFCSSETLGIAPIAEQSKVVLFSTGSSSPDITNAGDYVFRNYPSDASQGKILADIALQMGLKKAGMLTEENDYTIGISKVFRATFEAAGGTVTEETFLPDATDIRTQILKLKDAKVDLVFVNPQTPTIADLILKQLQEQKVTAKLFANDVTLGWQESLTRYKDFVEGMIGAEASYNKEHPDFVALVNEYKTLTGEADIKYPAYSATTYDGVMIVVEGLKAYGNNAEALKNFLYSIKDREGLAGKLTIDENGDPLVGHKAEIVKDGKVEPYVSPVAEAPGAESSAEKVAEPEPSTETPSETPEEQK